MRLMRATILFVAFAAQPLLAKPYGMAGCGLGSVVMGNSESKVSQILGATVNGTSGSQSFGITSGTSNCLTSAQVATLVRQQQFLVANLTTLEKELSQGGGETVLGFMEVLGCSTDAVKAGSAQLMQGYSRIFAAPGIDGILETAKAELRPQFAQDCKDLG